MAYNEATFQLNVMLSSESPHTIIFAADRSSMKTAKIPTYMVSVLCTGNVQEIVPHT